MCIYDVYVYMCVYTLYIYTYNIHITYISYTYHIFCSCDEEVTCGKMIQNTAPKDRDDRDENRDWPSDKGNARKKSLGHCG